MEVCNTHYYATRDPFGTSGDFTTAPEISQIFGELVGAWLADTWAKLGSPKAVLCEIGPGRGTLMKDILRATRNVPQFHASLRVRMIETSPTLTALQRKTLSGAHADIEWKTSLDDLPSLPLLLVANEFFDALPIHQFLQSGEERSIGLKDDAFCWLQEGAVVRETSPASLAVMQAIATHIKAHAGAALVADYGYDTRHCEPEAKQSSLAKRTTGRLDRFVANAPRDDENRDTLQALKNHAFHNPLETPGEADLTAHVDFGALQQQAQGLQTHYTTQGEFLRRLGAELRAATLCKQATPEQQKAILSGLERIVAPSQMGELFKVLAVTSILEKPAGF